MVKHFYKICVALAICFCCNLHSQTTNIPQFLDSLKAAVSYDEDKALLDTLIPLYNSAKSDTSRLFILAFIEENLLDEILWPKVTAVLLSHTGELLKNTKKYSPLELKLIYTTRGFALINKGKIASGPENKRTAYAALAEAISIFEKMKDTLSLAHCYYNVGLYHSAYKEIDSTRYFYIKSMHLYHKAHNAIGITDCLIGIALCYKLEGNIPKAISINFQGLKIKEQIQDWMGMASFYINISSLFDMQEDYKTSLEYLKKAVDLSEKKHLDIELGNALHNMGTCYNKMGFPDKAIEYYKRAIDCRNKIGDYYGLAYTYSNLGTIFYRKQLYDTALGIEKAALKIREELQEPLAIGQSYGKLSTLYFTKGNYKEAMDLAKKSYDIAKDFKSYEDTKTAALLISRVATKQNNYKVGLEMLNMHMAIKDTLLNDKVKKEALRKRFTHEYETREAEIKAFEKAEKDKIQFKAEEDKKRQRLIIYAICAGLLMLSVFSVFIYRALQENKKANKIISAQKLEVEHQKHKIEEHQKDILDSITYARRLQHAILPPASFINKHFPDNFVLYKPKDIVAGDFYFMEVEGDTLFFAAADCTGHGVPGAMVSVVCSNALNRAVKEFALREPGKILDKVRDLVIETFEKSESEVMDGMDISLCTFNKKTKKILWSGANNPLWYFSDKGIEEIIADKQPIGKTVNPKPFTSHEINISKGEVLFLFTDGYPDQFGGPKGKKFKYKKLEELLLMNKTKGLAEIQSILEYEFTSWKADLEQVDDVTIIGIRV